MVSLSISDFNSIVLLLVNCKDSRTADVFFCFVLQDVENKQYSNSSVYSSPRVLVVTTLILTLLLTICVSAVIYLAVWQQNTSSDNTSPEFVRHGTLQSYDQEGI